MWKLLKGTVASFLEDEALSRGAAIAFYTVTSLAPVLLIVIAIAGLVFGQDAAQNAITEQLTGLMGKQTADVLQSAVASAGEKSSGIVATVVGIVTLLATASGVFGEMQAALNKIWKAKPKSTTVSRLIRARAASLGLVAALGFLLTVSLVVSAGLTAVGNYLNSILPFGNLILSVLNFVVSLALMSVLFAAIYKVLPDRHIAWRDVIVGAIVTALLFTIGKSLIGLYLGSSAIASSYGAAGGLIILLFWVYYSAQIFLLGAEFTKVYATRHGSKQEGAIAEAESNESAPASRDVGTKGIPTSSFGDKQISPGSTAERQMTATNGHDPSLAQLEREAERNRAELMGTVDALQSRISPSAIKQDVQDYVRDKKDGMLRGLEERALENPLQTVAIAAVAAYPLWRIVTSIPVPLLLIGGGLALTRRPGRSTMSGGGSQDLVGRARERVGEVTDTLKGKLEDVSETVQQTVRSAKQMAERAGDQLSSLKSQTSQSAGGITDRMADKFSQTAETARAMSSDAASGASQMVSSGYRNGAEATARARQQVLQAGQRTQEALVETLERHPILVGAVGLAIGAAIAAALPATRPEARLFREVGGELKRKAREFASEGVQAVKSAAQDVYEETMNHAKDQGLSPEGVKEAAKDVGEKVTSVIASATGNSSERPASSESTLPKATSNPAT